MRKFLPNVCILLCIGFTANAQVKVTAIETITGKLEKITAPVKSYEAFNKQITGIYRQEAVNEQNTAKIGKIYGSFQDDPVVQRRLLNTAVNSNNPAPSESTVINNWDGGTAANLAPPDPTMATGPNHVVQLINGPGGSVLNIWTKTGVKLVNNVSLASLHSVADANGDPIVQYDKLADRWLLSEFTLGTNNAGPFKLVVLVSKTNDPTGQYYVYSYSFGAKFPDYPKYAVWQNAYYISSNNFLNPLGTPSYTGSSIMAMDRAKMLAGDPTASIINIELNNAASTYFNMSVTGYQGGAPPGATDPGMFTYIAPDEFTSATTDADSVGIIFFTPNFTTPASSTVNVQSLLAAPYNATVSGAIPQPGSTVTLDALDRRVMNQPIYRDFGTHKSLFMCHTVGITGNIAAIRWYELRNTGSGYTIFQQGTYSPDNTHRFMPSISVNKNGEMAIAYQVSSSVNSVFPGLRFAGRRTTDPLGTLSSYEETIIVNGNVSSTVRRAGDYSHLQVDPVDDTTFWFTGHYHKAPALFGGYTRISNFDLSLPSPWDVRMVGITNPVNNNGFCSTIVTPRVIIKNSGANTVTNLVIYSELDNAAPVIYNWTGSLVLGAIDTVNLAAFTTTGGAHTLKVYTGNPNGNADLVPANDTAVTNFTVLIPQTGPITEGFESTAFPPSQWRVINSNSGSITWQRTTLGAKSGIASTRMNFYSYSGGTGHLDFLLSPVMDAVNFDTALITFDRAYRKYNTSATQFNDTLLIQVSTDCGVSFPITVWKKGGADLATNPTPTTANWAPIASDWVTETIDLAPFLPANTSSFTISFTGKNANGQNLYLDNINIKVIKALSTDATLSKIIDPFTRVCSKDLRPVVQYGNRGLDTLKSVKINYSINGGPVQTKTLTGLSLARGRFATDTLPGTTLSAAGAYTIKVYTSEPNGLLDQLTVNDTSVVVFTVYDPVPAPLREGFEATAFPPANWSAVKSNTTYSWERNTRAANEGMASAWMRNRVYNGKGAKEDLYSPLIQVTNADSVVVRFDVAHVTAQYPGSTGVNLDTLEVLFTKDCGKTFTSVYKKWGETLQSTDPNFPGVYPANDSIAFVPQNKNQWRTDSVNITALTGNNGQFQLVFRNINNFGNNIFLDNININPIILPAKLKRQGYIVSPNPSEGMIYLQHYIRPANLKAIEIINSNGQLVWQKVYNGDAASLIPIDLSKEAAGVYIMMLRYNNKVETERIIKVQ
jgi:hypothetical protein